MLCCTIEARTSTLCWYLWKATLPSPKPSPIFQSSWSSSYFLCSKCPPPQPKVGQELFQRPLPSADTVRFRQPFSTMVPTNCAMMPSCCFSFRGVGHFLTEISLGCQSEPFQPVQFGMVAIAQQSVMDNPTLTTWMKRCAPCTGNRSTNN